MITRALLCLALATACSDRQTDEPRSSACYCMPAVPLGGGVQHGLSQICYRSETLCTRGVESAKKAGIRGGCEAVQTAFCFRHQQVSTPPTPLAESARSNVPADLEALIMECLEKEPARRPASALEVAQRLESLVESSYWSREQAVGWWKSWSHSRPSSPPTEHATVRIDLTRRGARGSATTEETPLS